MTPFEVGKWHVWEGAAGKVMLSDEDTKTLRSFSSLDDVVNFLWFEDQPAARAINKEFKVENNTKSVGYTLAGFVQGYDRQLTDIPGAGSEAVYFKTGAQDRLSDELLYDLYFIANNRKLSVEENIDLMRAAVARHNNE